MRDRVVIIGEVAVDVLVDCGPAEIAWGQAEQLVDDSQLVLGSSGAIAAAALAALGVEVAFAGVAGDDAPADFFLGRLRALGVDGDAVRRMPGATTAITVALQRGGDRAMLTSPGTMAQQRAEELGDALLEGAAHLHISSWYLQQGLWSGGRELLARARNRGVRTSLDPGWDPAQRWDSLAGPLPELDWLLPNEQEAIAIAGRLTGDPVDDGHAACEALAQAGPHGVAVKLGARGAVLCQAGEATLPATTYALRTAPLPALDATGAGDNFDAGLIAGLLDGADPAQALAQAVACGRHSVAGRGGTGRLATREEARAAAAALAPEVTGAPHPAGGAAQLAGGAR